MDIKTTVMERVMVIDFHAHILPELDHGCDSVQMAQKQLELAAKAEVELVVATSHFYPHLDTVEGFIKAREEAYGKLKEAAVNVHKAPKILRGAEVLACAGMERMEGLEQLCVEGTKVMLLELPFTKHWEKPLMDSVCKLAKQFQVVLAHADRYVYENVQVLVEAGCNVQLNADAVCKWSKWSLCRQFLKDGSVVALGSDIHGTGTGYRYFQKALKILGKDAVTIMKKTEEICGKAEVGT